MSKSLGIPEQLKSYLACPTYGCPKWVFIKSTKETRKEPHTLTSEEQNRQNIVMSNVMGLLKKLRRIFSKLNIPVHFQPNNTVITKTGSSQGKNGQVQAEQCVCNEECSDERQSNHTASIWHNIRVPTHQEKTQKYTLI